MYIKIIPSILMSLCCMFITAQEATEIYLFDLQEKENKITITNPVNISNNEGYDNQPSFTEDGMALLFSSFRDDQADIAKYMIDEGYRTWITDTEESEFSPMPVPGKKKYFTCVRLNNDDSQFLYKYAYKKKSPELLIPNLKVGYYLWFDSKTMISFVIGDIETLQVSNFKYKIKYPIQNNIGRSLQKIPATAGLGANLVSFISLEHEVPEIYAINPLTSDKKYITDALEGSQDVAWTAKGGLLMAKGNTIYKWNANSKESWEAIHMDTELLLDGISRIVISPDGSKLAVVVSESSH